MQSLRFKPDYLKKKKINKGICGYDCFGNNAEWCDAIGLPTDLISCVYHRPILSVSKK